MEKITENKVEYSEKQNVSKKVASKKRKYLVVLYCPKYTIIVDENGNNVQLDGDYKTKIGDYIEIWF